MTTSQHATRIALLTAFAAALLGWLAANTEVMYADGLRYIGGAQAAERGDWKASITRAVDHPVYPLAVAATHRLLGLGERPRDWQTAAQAVSVAAGVLLVIPLYLVALELHGPAVAWLACLLTYMVPVTGHVLADVLSEGVFLLFWTWGCWFALRFFRHGSTAWLPPTLAAAALAYMTRPEGLLLPAALAATLCLMIVRPSIRFARPVWLRATALVVVGPLLLVGPYVAIKGGIGTKPAVARLFGLAPKSSAMAVERERPLDPEQSAVKALAMSFRGMFRAVQGAVTTPLLLLAGLGLLLRSPDRDPGRMRARWFVAIVCVAWALALVRLYATGGYCTPRHALILALPLIAAAARAIVRLSEIIAGRFASDATEARRRFVQATACGACLAVCGSLWGASTLAPLNESYSGYRQAGEWLAAHTAAGRASPRPQGLGVVLRSALRLLVRRSRPGAGRGGLGLGRGARRLLDRPVVVLPVDPRPRRRTDPDPVVPREAAQGDVAGSYLRAFARVDPVRDRRLDDETLKHKGEPTWMSKRLNPCP